MWRYLVPATCYLVCGGIPMYVCLLFQDDPWYLVSRPSNITKLRELRAALNTTSRGGCKCYLAAFRNAVRFEIGGVVVAYVAEGDVRIVLYEQYIRNRMNETASAKNKSSRAAIRGGHDGKHGASTSCTTPTCDVRRRCRICRRREKRAF